MTLLIITIIGATTGGIVLFFVRLFTYNPAQLDTQKIGQVVTNTMIEGSPDIRGIRFTRNIIDASSVQYSYTYGYPTLENQLSVRFRWDATDEHVYQSTSDDGGSTWSSETVIPYHILSTTTIDGKDTSGVIFTYKKDADLDWVSGVDALANIRRVIIGINVKTGTGDAELMEGSSDITASAEIKDYR